MAVASPNDHRFVQCGHPDYPHVKIDFSEFSTGAAEANTKVGKKKWNGAFRGRPALIDALIPEIQTRYSMKSPQIIVSIQGDLRTLWRFLDSWEQQTGTRIDHLLDIGDLHGAAWVRQNPPPRRGPYQTAARLLNDARNRAQVAPVLWETLPGKIPRVTDMPDPTRIKLLYHELKRRAFAIFRRWKEADECAAKGKSLVGVKRLGCQAPRITIEDAHATYRDIIQLTGNPAPNAKVVGEILGLTFRKTMPRRWPSIALLQAGLYPTRGDVQVLFHLFLLQTGWNPQTTLDIDVSDDRWATDHTSGPSLKVLQSLKNRNHATQFFLSLAKPTTSPYRIVTALLGRTESLRSAITPERSLSPRVASRSPWIYTNSRDSTKYISPLDYSFGQGNSQQRFLRLIAREHNDSVMQAKERTSPDGMQDSADSPNLIPEDLKATDLRDAYIGHVYLRSGHNWLIAMFAAGHKSIRSLKNYLNHRSYRMASEKQVGTFQGHLWQEIEQHRIVDPAILHTLCRQGQISQEQRDRWLSHEDRTYVGMGCRDFLNPPREIAPDHRSGEGCRIQRCTLCKLGLLFSDSMPFLARRREELIWLREQIPTPTWVLSSFPEEEDSLILSLQNFSTEDVNTQRLYWRTEIVAGRHIPLSFEGAYG